MSPAAHPLAQRIHNRVLQLVGSALLKAEMCEQLDALGRADAIPATLAELRSALEDTCVELRSIMADLRADERADQASAPLKNLAA
jgi:hypothetical protein